MPARERPLIIDGYAHSAGEYYRCEDVIRTLDAVGGSTARAAEVLGVSVRKVQYRLKEYASGEGQPAKPGAEGAAEAERAAD